MMNRQAQAWGLKNTTFKNASGLTEAGHRSTPRDLVVIAQHIIRDFPEYYHYYSQRDYKFNNIHQDNRNLLLRRDPSVDGMKTGYTDAAGYCLLASAQRDFPNGKRRLIAIVMGAGAKEARADEAQKLLNWGYTAFDDVRLVEAGKAGRRAGAGVEGQAGAGRPRQRRRHLRGRAQGRGRAPEDADRAHRPAGGAARQGPARRLAEGDDGRPVPRLPRFRSRSSRTCPRPACSAAHGMPSGSGSSSLRPARFRRSTVPVRVSSAVAPPAPRLAQELSTMIALPDTLCYLDGEFLPLNQAKVSVMDRGFLFGDGAYESIPVYDRRMFRFDDHMARFERSLGKLEIEADLDRETWLARLRKVIAACPGRRPAASTCRSRAASRRARTWCRPGLTPTVFVTTSERSRPRRRNACRAWPASPRATSAGSAATSRAPRCWATCSRARSPPTRTPTRPSCCATTNRAARG
jgi:hypothetical protein